MSPVASLEPAWQSGRARWRSSERSRSRRTAYSGSLMRWLEGHTIDAHIGLDAPKFRRVLPGNRDPSLIVASSHDWDLATAWQNEGAYRTGWQPDMSTFLPRWSANVKRQLLLLGRTFPNSTLAWRTDAPSAAESGLRPDYVDKLRWVAKALLATDEELHHVREIDWAAGLWSGTDDPNATIATYPLYPKDMVHPGRTDSLSLVFMALGTLCSERLCSLHEVCSLANASTLTPTRSCLPNGGDV